MLKSFTNDTATPMPVRLRSGVMAWVRPGQTRELDVREDPAPAPAPQPGKPRRKR